MSFSVGRAMKSCVSWNCPDGSCLTMASTTELEFTDKTSRKACAGTPVLGVLKRGTGVEGASSSSILPSIRFRFAKRSLGFLAMAFSMMPTRPGGSSGWNCVTGGGGSFTMR